MKRLQIILAILGLLGVLNGFAQCGSAQGDETTFGSNSWIGYFYDGANNFTSGDYQGYNTESEIFNQTFCGNNCTYAINGCSVTTETFTVRYKMNKNFSNAIYRFTIGGDDGVRLSIDNGSTYLINEYRNQSYTTYNQIAHLSGSSNLILEYYENSGDNRVSFTYTNMGSSYGGTVSESQNICASGVIDPAAFSSNEPAMFTSGTVSYQWQESNNNSIWTDIASATNAAYDIPSGFPSGTTRYFRRKATNGGAAIAYSNTLTIVAGSNNSAGDQVSYGNGSWIGYVYDGQNNFTTNYKGELFETEIFDESFGGSNTTTSTTGCDFQTETFSVRFKMRKTFGCGDYTFTIGADDGVRLSIDGGTTWLVNDYSNHGYRTVSSAPTSITDGTYDLVIEYYEAGGGNRVTFDYNVVSCTLPVTWYSFEGVAKSGYNEIEWKTATEENNEGFSVERSADGMSFEEIGWVNGNGTTTDQKSYLFDDTNAFDGTNYYRLKQIDYDGNFEYSEIISVISVVETNDIQITLYPNPSTDYVQVQSASSKAQPSMQLVNVLLGHVIQPPNEGSGRFNLQNVPAGIYVARIQIGEDQFQKRLIVQE
ncbi:MAG: T9SS type A sorting domain-containing protein [Cyclobacteriaceae bacterium]|nr:T9SS type A sorting domain-containing protein [Cyclobacteriaceae bacterium]